ncbi:MAG: NAD(P)-binding domain-containing protein, partial [bacterium]
FVACESLESLVAATERPRRIVLLVPDGAPVDESLDGLDGLLDADDIVIDSGNSLFLDTDRRAARAKAAPWRFVGMGISGGSEGGGGRFRALRRLLRSRECRAFRKDGA